MKNDIRSWNFMRVLRLTLGIIVIVQGVAAQDWRFVVLGGVFSLLPVLNIGCCGTSGCYTTVSKNNKSNEDISYEEIR